MTRLQQGSIVWAELPPPFGRRPVLILTRDTAIPRLNAVTVGPITRTIHRIPTEVVLEPTDGVRTTCAISLDNIFTVQKSALRDRIAVLGQDKMLLVFAAIRAAFEMS